MKYQWIAGQKGRYSQSFLCKILQVSRSGYYRFSGKKISQNELTLVSLIQSCRRQTGNTYGYRRIKLWLRRKHNLVINGKKLLRIMRKYQLLSVIRKRKLHKPTGKPHSILPNLLNQKFIAQKKNRKWVTDITYIRTPQGTLFLSAILDLFDRSIVDYRISASPDLNLVTSNLERACKKEKVASELILHSDQGSVYTSRIYQQLGSSYGITFSMSRKGNCYDNIVIEGFFSILKTESIYLNKPRTFSEARRSVKQYIHFYNNQRLQLKSGQTPLNYFYDRAFLFFCFTFGMQCKSLRGFFFMCTYKLIYLF